MKSRTGFLEVGSHSSFSRYLVPAIAAFAAVFVVAQTSAAQVPTKAPLPVMTAPPPPVAQASTYDAAELDRIMSPIALYPDPLLAQVLTASTFAAQVPQALSWVDGHHGLSGAQLADALTGAQVTWDPSVQSLVAFPTVLQMMAASMPWTNEIGDAFQNQHGDVMDAVQRLRSQAQHYGYLQSTPQVRVVHSQAIEIVPVDPEYMVVPYYDPLVVFVAPRPRFLVSSAIYFGYGVRLGVWYDPWGWGNTGFYWPSHRVYSAYPSWGRYGYREPLRPSWYSAPRVAVTPRGYTDPRRPRPDVVVNRPVARTAASPAVRVAQPRVTAHDAALPSAPRAAAPRAEAAPRSATPRSAPHAGGEGGGHGERSARARPR